jgi:very-short-patch-repair endonuclease
MLEKPHERILVVAPSNRAIDVFVEQLLIRGLNKKLQVLLDTRKILRYGYPRKRSVIDRPELLGPPGLDLLSAQVRQAAKSIERAERQKASAAELAVLRSSMLELQEQVKQAVHDHVAGCTLVATTVTLAYLANSPIHGSSWNTVIVDEATMVAPVMQLFLSSLATDRFLVAGDPRQLGPVYESRNQPSTAASVTEDHDYTWMGRDIFDLCGVAAGSGIDRTISTSDNRMVRITGQRRCAPDIWSRVSSLYPTVSLMSDEERSEWIRNLPPYPGKEIVILDTGASGTQSRCTNEHGSWKNQFSADLAMEVACMLAAETERDLSIAIITPYRAQVRLLRKAITQEQRATRLDGKELLIESGTVHQFQGSDADVVLFDLVDGFGHHGLGKLLQGDNGVRLATVAITRAKGKLIVLADRTWCADPRNFERATNPVLWDLIVKASSSEILPVIPFPPFIVDKRRAKTESPIETTLYDEMMLHADMEHLVAQHPIQDQNGLLVSRADFAFPELKLAIFCDGRHWHLREDRWQRDIRQRNRLAELGWTFLVFTGKEIIRDPSGCVAVIQATRSMLDKQHGPRNKT